MLSIGFFTQAMLAKTSVVMFPVVLLLHAWWKRGTITQRDVVAAAPFFLVSLGLGLVTIYYQHGRAIGEEKMPVAELFSVVGFLSRTATAGMAILFYLWKTIWPFHLLPIYPRWEVDPPQIWQFLPWPILVVAGCGLWSRRGTAASPTPARHALFGLGFFLLMVFPILGFITISYMRITWVADHFIYVAMIGVIVPVCAAAATWFASTLPRTQIVAMVAASLVLIGLAGASFRYAHVFANEDTLWTHTLASNPNAWQAHNRIGARKYARGDLDGALYHFENSTKLRPDLGETHNNLGTTYMALGRTDEAIEQFKVTTELLPNVFTVQLNRGNALTSVGRNEQAEKWYQEVAERFPKEPQAWNNLGIIQMKKGDRSAGIASLRRAVELMPDFADARTNLDAALRSEAEALAVAGNFAESEVIYGELLKRSPDDVMLLTNRGVVLYKLGKNDAAIAAFRRALAINPGAKEATESLAVALGQAAPAALPPVETTEPVPSTLSPSLEGR
jgi:tetratricopeptide (TPR) repeat protein